MNRFIRTTLAITLTAAASAALAAEPGIAVDTSRVPAPAVERVKAKAAQGIDALRRYVTSTRAIYAIDLAAVVREEALAKP